MTPALLPHLLLLAAAATAAGCADGGTNTFPQSGVRVSANHHIWAFTTPRLFSRFPVPATEAVARWGTFSLQSNSQYQVVLNGVSGSDNYSLDDNGLLGVFVVPNPRSGVVRFLGAYGLEGDTGVYYFTDRFTSSTSNVIGMFFGTRIEPGTPDVEGAWHLFSQHVIFASSLDVGRTAAGTVAIDAAGAITGSGVESTRAALTFSGTATPFAGSRLDLTVDYRDAQTVDTRLFLCGTGEPHMLPPPPPPPPPSNLAAHKVNGIGDLPLPPSAPPPRSVPRVILGLDQDTTDGEAGLIALVAERTGTADPALLAGSYYVGLSTVFVDLVNPGTDAAHGTLQFSAQGGFTITGQGAGGITFSYGGTYQLADDGGLTLSVSGTNETWTGAVDQDYEVVVIADNQIETRTGNKPPELNLFLALRQGP